jgi:hypothetical protein
VRESLNKNSRVLDVLISCYHLCVIYHLVLILLSLSCVVAFS